MSIEHFGTVEGRARSLDTRLGNSAGEPQIEAPTQGDLVGLPENGSEHRSSGALGESLSLLKPQTT